MSRILVGPSPSLVTGVAAHARVELLPGADAVKSAMIALGAAPRAPAPAAPSHETIVPCNHCPFHNIIIPRAGRGLRVPARVPGVDP